MLTTQLTVQVNTLSDAKIEELTLLLQFSTLARASDTYRMTWVIDTQTRGEKGFVGRGAKARSGESISIVYIVAYCVQQKATSGKSN